MQLTIAGVGSATTDRGAREVITVPRNELWGQCRKIASVSLLVYMLPLLGTAQNKSSTQENQQGSTVPLRAAQSALERGHPEEAIRILSDYLQTRPDDSRARLMLGQAYASVGQTDGAVKEFEIVLKIAPDNYVALAALGEIYEGNGQPEKAELLLGRAVKASDGIPQIRLEWAIVLARLHQYQKAERALAGLLPPTDREEGIAFHRLKASVALGLGSAAAAASEMEKALALKPDDEGLILATAAAQLQSGNWQRAEDLTGPFASSHDPAAGMILLEAQLGAKANFQPTLDLLRSNATNAPNELAIRQRLAELLVAHNKYSESIEDFQRAVELHPDRADLLFNQSLAQFRAGRLDDALASAKRCKELGDNADLEDLVGDIQEARGDNLAAMTSFQQAVALAPTEERYRLSLALEFIRHKNFDAAKVVLQQAKDLHPDSWRISFALGMVEYFAGNEETASGILLHAAKLSPDPPVALKYLGDIQMDRAAGPDPATLSELCKYADVHPKEPNMQYYCGALLFRRDYASEDKTNMSGILRRLNAAAARLPNDAAPHCQLGKAYRWLEQWQAALRESEKCAKLDPESAQAHYRLGQIYHHEGQTERAKQEMNLYAEASKRIADDNARRDETMKSFLFTIQKEEPDHP
jgi:tetratricopeptide (TPR) repeat protein